MPACLIGLGANLGQREAALRTALQRLARTDGLWGLQASRNHETAPVGGPGQPPFLNAAARFQTWLPPRSLLAALQRIEQEAGRDRAVRWGPRTLDLDLLLYGHAVVSLPGLEVPHPWLAVRRFVLEPAVEVAARWVHPVNGWTLRRLAEHLDASPRCVRVVGATDQMRQRFAEQLAQRVAAEPGPAWEVSADACSTSAAGHAPRLTLLLDSPTDRHADRQALLQAALAMQCGPVLLLPAEDLPSALEDAAAALDSCG